MKKIVEKIYNKIIWIYYKLINPNKVAKLRGVRYGKNCNFRTKEFGSEPYLIKVGNNVCTSLNVTFITHDGSVNILRYLYNEYKDIDILDQIIIGNNVFIGHSVILLPGTTIGDNVIVGAGSIVKGKLLSNSVYAGVPAKFICTLEEYINKNKNKFTNTKHLSPKEKKEFLINKYNL